MVFLSKYNALVMFSTASWMYFVLVMLMNVVWSWHVARDGVISTVTVDGARYVVITTVVGAMVVTVVVKSEWM